MTKGRTGAEYGRSGGRASGASRARSALAKAPRVKVVGAIAKNQKKSAPALGTMSDAQAKAASNAVLLMADGRAARVVAWLDFNRFPSRSGGCLRRGGRACTLTIDRKSDMVALPPDCGAQTPVGRAALSA